ncbi:MAG: glycosyltransferase family 39 protein [Bacteroidia bacterium]|nr:glycosyltransferase family 39 protein [Bacteroidia bacterium]
MISKQKKYFFLIIFLVAFLLLWKIGKYDLQEWDESRNGVNAYEMLQNKDFVNYYYNNQLDTWNAKPPLMIWLIGISYKIFGFNEFALRFPTFISAIIFFIFCFKIIELLSSTFKAFLCCLILLSCKAILGNHVGLTGDFDMLLISLLTASVYYFILYIEYQKKHAVFLVAITTGFAFYTKGPACLIFIPGFIIYAVVKDKCIELLKDKKIWISIALFITIVSSWLLLVFSFGKTTDHSFYGSKNSIETMIIYDTFNRLTNTDFGHTNVHDNYFFFAVIDARLNLWNYLFYLGIVFGLYGIISNRKKLKLYICDDSKRLILLSVCLILPLSIVLTLAIDQNNWYLAPIFMFIVFIIVETIFFIGNKWKPSYFIILMLFVFTFGRHLSYLYCLPNDANIALSSNQNFKDKKIIVTENLKQNILLYFKWLNMNIVKTNKIDDLANFKGELLLINKNSINNALTKSIEPLHYFEEYCLAKIK